MITAKNLKKHELIGLEAEIITSNNEDLVGLKGKIVDETRNLIVLETKKGEKKILKKEATFKIKIQDEEVRVDGNVLVGRPEERIKK
ncbi:ribonuclease P protein component 1 [archaeon]|nr:ribonuclease P protein component 1 [archaeon]|tara:strand:+ start:1598 stop:1858 length:261 start_codon:yes stop_codon:yes gene_type:complete